jgi:hypothetical protein
MLPELSIPPSFARLLAGLRPCFTAPSFVTFCALVCGMLVGAGLSGSWSHDRAHKFFSAARWSPEDLWPASTVQCSRLQPHPPLGRHTRPVHARLDHARTRTRERHRGHATPRS